VELERQTIERRDFPIARRGYEPAAVDAHLQALARDVEELVRGHASAGAEPSLASAASSQVQSILQAAETAAADIERDARELAQELRQAAERDARETREQAIEQARAHVTAVSRATSALLERVGALDAEASALLESLRAGANRLAADLTTVDANMGELYDAASGRGRAHAEGATTAEPPSEAVDVSLVEPLAGASGGAAPASASPAPASASPAAPPASAVGHQPATVPQAPPASSEPSAPTPSPAAQPPAPAAGEQDAEDGDVDGARLVALNMALNGETRETTERYLAENFRLSERRRLVDEVYAAIES
jgi:DivIVA domain-containing protein